jgi:hypothetical protein
MAEATVPRLRKKVLAMKPETTYGTDIFAGTYTAADIIPAMDIQVSPNLEELEILATSGHLGRQQSAIGMESASVTFRMAIRGIGAGGPYSASVKPEWHNPLEGCSLIATLAAGEWTYAPSIAAVDSHKSQTIYVVNHVGGAATALTYQLVGCHGDVEFSMRAGAFIDARFTFQGLIAGVSDVTYVGGVLTAVPYPVMKSAAFQIGTENYAPRIANVGYRHGNVLQRIPSINSTGGLVGFFVSDRNPRLSIDPEVTLEATYPWYTKWTAGTLSDVTFQTSAPVANDQISFNFPRLQVVAQPTGERDGMSSLATTLLATILTGDDDVSIVAEA